MYLSRLAINPRRREARKLLANPRAMHAAVESSFPPREHDADPDRVLWRVDETTDRVTLYVVSPTEPDMTHLVEAAGWETAPGESLQYSRFLKKVEDGQRFQFRVTVNPVKRLFVPGNRGKLVPHVTEDQQLAWFYSREERWGFHVPLRPSESDEGAGDERLARVVKRLDRSFSKPESNSRRTVTQRHVTIVGELGVTDATAFRNALVGGLGRGKAYGCGLMTLMKVGA
ncbi:type I-E CRISPR-associated protein Cas6/Cse3/CasE [Flaviflexus huanghaiensis]|uniref:type I-E CRISPR-associated protein Cas6/Cse3/CasE n=1 Tax=Flaviflexus huanghaiensis TaxID=1111473 RepID=UPI0015FCA8B3|nr:type I-E CRISPR-associated protein Cas6/Cse3/CasE [Flaviflexus huanghaiensis]